MRRTLIAAALPWCSAHECEAYDYTTVANVAFPSIDRALDHLDRFSAATIAPLLARFHSDAADRLMQNYLEGLDAP